ncbi:L-histidine N(alpha)-methyltransferase [Sphingobacterium oryzagri]|uniref:L-histidine N(Alpha)-methyltransferase n=1 Tax=Sphingobacterium oryzagri TaxID=3025669 RepID=A0ABY7WS69_9SPHI|nr:L-histidine N(alpha)-methyltransferase [Sphingobacterium sp. KACC 22765]WDF70154.1 L-histidine N(alpha)-methyltransferase [Sphingobacterium sp. KACC 22765]
MRKEHAGVTDCQQDKTEFYRDVMVGLRKSAKSLPSKYFYDARGDVLFQQIMRCPEYYLTRCEEEIFKKQTNTLVKYLFQPGKRVDLIELGVGDASKTHHLLARLLEKDYEFTYRPIDISTHIITELQTSLPTKFPSINISAFQGDYFAGLAEFQKISSLPKIVLFLGANIGNMPREQAQDFCKQVRQYLNKGDRMLVGFDLMKNPRIVQAAYDDEAGLTWRFNINLLHRINSELGADFNTDLFEHYCQYDPIDGTCSSYLVSLLDQVVHFSKEKISFEQGEVIHMEVSQKYKLEEINALAERACFSPIHRITDSKAWFVDAIWEAI